MTLVHEGLTAEQEVGHAEGWNHFLGRLEQAAATGDAGPDEWAAAPQTSTSWSAPRPRSRSSSRVLRNLTDEDRTRATPCSEFDCHALAEHLFGSLTGLAPWSAPPS